MFLLILEGLMQIAVHILYIYIYIPIYKHLLILYKYIMKYTYIYYRREHLFKWFMSRREHVSLLMGAVRTSKKKSNKVSFIGILYSTQSSEMTFENWWLFCGKRLEIDGSFAERDLTWSCASRFAHGCKGPMGEARRATSSQVSFRKRAINFNGRSVPHAHVRVLREFLFVWELHRVSECASSLVCRDEAHSVSVPHL